MWKGIDVSDNQGAINWAQIPKNVDFAILRSVRRSGKADHQFAANLEGCRKRNIPMSVYKYTYAATPEAARQEAQQVVALLQSYGLTGTMVWWDVEDKDVLRPLGAAKLTECIRAAQEVITAAGYSFGLYVGLYVYNECWFDFNAFSGTRLWVARYYKGYRTMLFADEPGALLAGQGMRADIRVFHYQGKAVQRGEVPNLLLPPKTISGPVVEQIAKAQAYVLERLAKGLIMEGSGFKTRYRFPERVIKEAITNAVVHRDYRLNRDIHIRIFDDRVEVESPGRLPGNLTPATIDKAGSVPRNSLLARHLREFPNPPNVDAGEGVPMMFAQMAQAKLYEPLYREQVEAAVPTLLVTLLNEERPPLWVQVSDWIDRNGPIANGKLREISGLDTLAASKQLRQWVAQGVLVALPAASRQQASYTKPELAGLVDLSNSLSFGLDNES